MTRFAERFRVESIRLKNWDYSSPGIYFVTICTLNHNKFFGEIVENREILSKRGELVDSNIRMIEDKFDYVHLSDYVIMPNHVHLLIKIKNSSDYLCRDSINAVSTYKNQMTVKSLSRVIQWIKGKSTFEIRRELKIFFGWQTRFYDIIVKDKEELKKIREYIKHNPENWQKDRFYK